MLVIPAIDLQAGKCVRLRQGDMDCSTVFSDDPVAMARVWVAAGAQRLHLVDLDGAVAGQPLQRELVTAMAVECGVDVQVGGGVRTAETAVDYLDAGVRYVILGTRAARDPDFVVGLGYEWPGRIIVGIDARDGLVAVEGWADVSQLRAEELAQRYADSGVAAIIYTDIAQDGMLTGLNLSATQALARVSGVPVIASGGVRNLSDIRGLKALDEPNIEGVIAGRALYEGTLDLSQALAEAS